MGSGLGTPREVGMKEAPRKDYLEECGGWGASFLLDALGLQKEQTDWWV